MDTRSLAANGLARDQRERTTEKLHEKIAPRQVSFVVLQAVHHVNYADPAGAGAQPLERNPDHDRAGNRQREAHRDGQGFKPFDVAERDERRLSRFDRPAKGDHDGTREETGNEAYQRLCEAYPGGSQTHTKAFESLR